MIKIEQDENISFENLDMMNGCWAEIRKNGRKLKWNVIKEYGFSLYNRLTWDGKTYFTVDKEFKKLNQIEFTSNVDGNTYNIKLLRNRIRINHNVYQ